MQTLYSELAIARECFGKIIHALAEVQGQAEDWEKGNVSGMPSLLEAVGLGKV